MGRHSVLQGDDVVYPQIYAYPTYIVHQTSCYCYAGSTEEKKLHSDEAGVGIYDHVGEAAEATKSKRSCESRRLRSIKARCRLIFNAKTLSSAG